MEDSLFNRRELLTGGVIAALGALWLPSKAGAATTPPPGVEGATLTFDVACLGNTLAVNAQAALDAKGGDMRGSTFSVEGNLYPSGTIPAGTGWDPTSVAPTGHWFCRGWFILNAARPVPHLMSTVEYLFSRISDAQPSPVDQIVSSGVEGGTPVVTRSIIGGAGRYRGMTGELVEQVIGSNTTVLNGSTNHAPNWRIYVTL